MGVEMSRVSQKSIKSTPVTPGLPRGEGRRLWSRNNGLENASRLAK